MIKPILVQYNTEKDKTIITYQKTKGNKKSIEYFELKGKFKGKLTDYNLTRFLEEQTK